MSVDLRFAIGIIATVIALGILAVGLFRAIQMGRGFVNRLYRDRAFWTAAVIALAMVSFSVGSITANQYGLVDTIPFVALFLTMFVFADQTILVAIDTDFFHRNALHWRQARKLLYAIVVADAVYFVVGSFYAELVQIPVGSVVSPLIAFYTLFGALGVTIAALAVVARRSPDRIIKRHVGLFGLFIVGFVATLLTTQPGIPLVVNVAGDLIAIATAYSLYLMVMSLSPVGRVERTAEVASQPP